jgi:hypothetical protein
MKKYLVHAYLFVFIMSIQSFCIANPTLNEWLAKNHCVASVKMTQYDYSFFNKPTSYKVFQTGEPDSTKEIYFQEAAWQTKYQITVPSERPDALELEYHFKLIKGNSPQTSISIDFTFDNWSKSNYVLMPAAAYNGNRFESRRIRYSPKLLDSRDIGPDKPIIISDVPQLNINDGPSRIQERSGSMSVPSIGIYGAFAGFSLFI